MASQSPLKKTAAIRRAREAVLPPFSRNPPHFVVRVPSDVREINSDLVELTATDYLAAQHIRSFSISRIALALMGLADVPLALEDGGTIAQFMDKALDRVMQDPCCEGELAFWQVRLSSGSADTDRS